MTYLSSLTKLTLSVVTLASLGLAGTAAQAQTSLLWYNGDFNGANALANERNTSVSDAAVYENFNVTDAGGWNISEVFSNNLMSLTGVNSADWEIRSGVSTGNGGTLVAGGTSSAAQSLTGRNGFGYNEYKIDITGLNVNLAQGVYWLMVRPVGFGSERSFVSLTGGANSVGTPAGNDGTSHFNSSFFGTNFSDTSTVLGSRSDFSLGIVGSSAVPEPGAVAFLVGIGMTGASFVARRRRWTSGR